jgi:hypothetical protein
MQCGNLGNRGFVSTAHEHQNRKELIWKIRVSLCSKLHLSTLSTRSLNTKFTKARPVYTDKVEKNNNRRSFLLGNSLRSSLKASLSEPNIFRGRCFHKPPDSHRISDYVPQTQNTGREMYTHTHILIRSVWNVCEAECGIKTCTSRHTRRYRACLISQYFLSPWV